MPARSEPVQAQVDKIQELCHPWFISEVMTREMRETERSQGGLPQPLQLDFALMSDDTLKIKRKLSTLNSSLDNLENSLTALLSQSLPDLVIGLDSIQQAKLQVVIPYLVYDLVFGPSLSTHSTNRPA